MKLKPRHRWFSNTDKNACENWCGPHKTIEDAFEDCVIQLCVDPLKYPIYIARGRKMTKDELSGMEDVDFTWNVDTQECFEIKLWKQDVRLEDN